MKRFRLLFLMTAIVVATTVSFADTEYYKRVGTGGYGVSVKKINCPNCGKVIDANESHMCRKVSSSSSSSSGYSDDSYDGPVDVGAKYPDLLINQTSYTPATYDASSSQDGGYSNSDGEYDNKASEALHTYKSSSKKKSHAGLYIVIVLAIAVWFFYRRYRKKRKAAAAVNAAVNAPVNIPASPNPVEPSPEPYIPPHVNVQSQEPINAAKDVRTQERPATKASSGSILDKINEMKTKASEMIETAKNSEQAQKMQSSINSGLRSAKEKAQTLMENAVSKGKSVSVVDELAKLNELHKAGALTDEEYDRLKKRLIG